MARPRKVGMDYFPHDVDAVNDEKIEVMRALYGNDGYAFYFILLERIYRTENGELDITNNAIRLTLIKKLLLDEQKFNEMLQTAFDIRLFDRQAYEERGVITSHGIKKRVAEVSYMREKERRKKENVKENDEEKIVFPGENSRENEEETEVLPKENANKSKEKKSKEKKINNIVVVDDINNTHQQQQQIYDQDLKELSDFFSKNIHPITPVEYEDIREWLKEGIPKEVIKEAIMEAVRYNKRSMKYINKILIRWDTLGLKTIEAVQAYIRDWQDRKNKGDNDGKYKGDDREDDPYAGIGLRF